MAGDLRFTIYDLRATREGEQRFLTADHADGRGCSPRIDGLMDCWIVGLMVDAHRVRIPPRRLQPTPPGRGTRPTPNNPTIQQTIQANRGNGGNEGTLTADHADGRRLSSGLVDGWIAGLLWAVPSGTGGPGGPMARKTRLTIRAHEYKLSPCASSMKRFSWRQGGNIPRQPVTWMFGVRRSKRQLGAIWWRCGKATRTPTR
jgi:hypothetical protein